MIITSRKVDSPKGKITLWRIENGKGGWVVLSSLGAGIVEVGVPDSKGKIENVALSYSNPADYLYDGPCLGKCPGRYANRIAKGILKIDGMLYQLAVNNGPNALHGGPEGFQNQIWESKEIQDGVEFSYISADGEEHYPGKMEVRACYTWSEDNILTLKFEARSDADTVVNLTNHAYWNLDGADAGSVLEHGLRLKAAKWLPTDETLIPTGTLADVAGTPMDFRCFKSLGEEIGADFPALKYGKGYDNCWAIDGWEPGKMVNDAAVLVSAKSGRRLHVDSDQPGVQIYTGNWLDGSPANKSGKSYSDYDGVAIEMQGFPDAPNRPDFPSQLLKAGETYCRTIRFRFEV